MEEQRLAVIADVVRSRDLADAERRRLQERVVRLAGDHVGFRFSGGDEFEWHLPDEPESLDRVLLLRARLAAGSRDVPGVMTRCGLGRGALVVRSDASPYAEDGPAFHRAREALRAAAYPAVRGRRSHTDPFSPGTAQPRLTAFDDGAQDPVRDALLVHMDRLLLGWTERHWQTVALVLEGLRYEEVGERLGLSAQGVHKRLGSAELDLYLEGHEALKRAWRTLP
ncbi:MAG: hypothetical protein ACQEXJ_05750 [Myxococcota bacterium]